MDFGELMQTIAAIFIILIFLIVLVSRAIFENKYDEIMREKVYQIQVVTPDGKVYPVSDYSYYWEIRGE